jgi:ABC-type multidrug transport system fused ATPase/permease subunit
MFPTIRPRVPARLRTSPWLLVAARLGEERGRLAPLAAALLLSTLLPLAGPQLMATFVDRAVEGAALDALLWIGAAYLAVAAAGQAARIAASSTASGVAWRTTNRLREQAAGHAMRLDMGFHGRHTPGEMIERVDGDLMGLTQFITGFVVQALGSAMLLAGTLVLVWRIDVRVGALLAALVAVGATVLVLAQRRVIPFAATVREETAQMFGAVEERLAGAEEVRANGAARHVVRRFQETAGRVLAASVRFERRAGAVLAGTNLLFAVGTAALLAVGILLRQAGAITVGTVVLLFQYAQMVRAPIEDIVRQAKQLHEAGAAATRVAQLLAERPDVVWTATPWPLPHGPLSLRFAGVTFAYPGDPPVLHGVELELGAGRTLGVVGRTGSGKTTLARLALRLYDPTQGSVLLGGVDLRGAGREELRRRVRMVTQEVHLFTASLRDNVTLFDDEADDASVQLALDTVGLRAWRRALPDGLDTRMGAGGVGLSAGEAQLVALARVFLADPAVVVLDEASSRLDPATEEVVRVATARLLAGRTAIVIAHRLSTLVGVDEIAVVDGGRIVEHGPRAALARNDVSRFARLLTASEAAG